MHQALYRKWRPSSFDDVVGQEHITTTLKNQVASGKPSHAYLFCGSRGTGKTSCSKILAKAVNCPDQKDGNPCGVCNICVGIDNDSILDVTEIDAASNSGVDNIRELREEANFTPVMTKYRVYIIDETHMLSTGAFNALLKIMEEPPAHVIFILATTEINKVPATVLSRCQRFDFHRLSSKVIAEHLLHVSKEENVSLAPEAAAMIARLSDGAMRDSLSLLDLCFSLEGEITYEMVQEVSGLSDQSYLEDILKMVIEGDYFGTLTILSELWVKSIDPTQFCRQLLGTYRNLLVVKSTKSPNDLIDATPSELESLNALSEQYSIERIFYSTSTLSDTLGRMSSTSMRRAELEAGLLKLCNPAISATPEALAARIESLEQSLKHAKMTPVTPQSNPSVKETPPLSPPKNQAAEPEPSKVSESSVRSDLTEAVPFEPWQDVLQVLKRKNVALFGTLIDSKAYLVGDLLLVDAGSELFAQVVRSDEYARDSLREAAYEVTGTKYRLGPYQPDQYEVIDTSNHKLDEIIQSAKDLGVNIEITE